MPALLDKQNSSEKSDRMDFRVTASSKAAIKRAAAIKGVSFTDFVVAAAYDAATITILGHELMNLDPEQSRRVAESLVNPPEPNDALMSLLRGRPSSK